MKLEVISLIFRSTKFLKFTENQMLKYCKNFDDIEVSHRIIANDATKNVLEAATDCSIPVWEFNNTNPNSDPDKTRIEKLRLEAIQRSKGRRIF